MDTRNETNSQQCRFLDETYFLKLYNVFIAAFSDYVMPFELTEQQFRNHIVLNAVDLSLSVGVIDEEKLIGFTLNGFGMWLGVNTVYDAGTGVLPEFRRRGLSKTMFDIMTPVFKDRGVEQWLLEVITTNEKAIGLYKKLGFYTSRTLSLLQPESELSFHADSPVDIVLRDIHEPDWSLLRTFWNGEPSWQNSIDALSRSRMNKRFIGAFHGDDCLGYIVFSTNFARLAQIAVDRNYRGLGIGSLLLKKMLNENREDGKPQVINIDNSIQEAMTFFKNRGFTTKLRQFEMIRVI